MSSQIERVSGDKTDYTQRIGRAVSWVRESIRDALRGYSDQAYLQHLALASGQITPADRESYQSRRVDEVCYVPMSLPNPGTDSIVLNSTPIENVTALNKELTRLRQLTPKQLNEEIRNDAVRWLDEHHLQIRGQID